MRSRASKWHPGAYFNHGYLTVRCVTNKSSYQIKRLSAAKRLELSYDIQNGKLRPKCSVDYQLFVGISEIALGMDKRSNNRFYAEYNNIFPVGCRV